MGAAFGAGVEGNQLPIGRPSRASRKRAGKECQLHGVRSVRVANPDFLGSRTPGLEGDPRAVRRKLGRGVLLVRAENLTGASGSRVLRSRRTMFHFPVPWA